MRLLPLHADAAVPPFCLILYFFQVRTLVEPFCKKHDVHYHEASIWEGTKEVLSHLSDVSAEFIAEFPAM